MIAPVSEETSSAAEPPPPGEPTTSERPELGLEAFAGAYESRLWSHDEMRPGRTELGTSAHPTGGSYTFEQEGEVYVGQLLACSVSSPTELLCTWRDAFGTGQAVLVFDEGRRGFAGSWWTDGDEANPHPWVGVRAPP